MANDKQSIGGNEASSRFEPWLLKHICEPLLARTPTSIHPNSISLFNHLLCWLVFFAAATAPHVGPWGAFGLRIFAGVGLFATMVLDCLDGMQARKTGKCSKLGEVMDHWLDAINVPLAGAGFILTLGLDPWTTAVAIIVTAAVYNFQLVLYHHTGKYVFPPTSGVDAQAMCALAYGVVGLVFLVGRDSKVVSWLVFAGAWASIFITIRLLVFYLRKLRSWLAPPISFVLLSAGFTAVHVAGWTGAIMCVLFVVFLSFRITGTYVLSTVVGRQYHGFDVTAFVWLMGIVGANVLLEPMQLRSYTLQGLLPHIACLHLATLSVIDLIKELPSLRPAGAANTVTP